jgi:hypothetical protein
MRQGRIQTVPRQGSEMKIPTPPEQSELADMPQRAAGFRLKCHPDDHRPDTETESREIAPIEDCHLSQKLNKKNAGEGGRSRPDGFERSNQKKVQVRWPRRRTMGESKAGAATIPHRSVAITPQFYP